MKFCINTFLFTSPFTNSSTKLFRKFKDWGFDAVELPVEDTAHIDPAHVKRELDRHGLVCGGVCACMSPDRDLRGTLKQQRTSLSYLKTLVDYAVELDCPTMTGPIYSACGRAEFRCDVSLGTNPTVAARRASPPSPSATQSASPAGPRLLPPVPPAAMRTTGKSTSGR